jgi:hypothetical protein
VKNIASIGVCLFFIVSLAGTTPTLAAFQQVPIGDLANANIRVYSGGASYPVAPTTLSVAETNVVAPAAVYTLINSAFGAFGATNATIEFVGANGANAVFNIVQGDNIRDHINNVFNNVAVNVVPTEFGADRLDRQTFVLPNDFAADTLTKIVFTAVDSGNPQGQAFLAAVTVATVPEPHSLLLLSTCALGILSARRR